MLLLVWRPLRVTLTIGSCNPPSFTIIISIGSCDPLSSLITDTPLLYQRISRGEQDDLDDVILNTDITHITMVTVAIVVVVMVLTFS